MGLEGEWGLERGASSSREEDADAEAGMGATACRLRPWGQGPASKAKSGCQGGGAGESGSRRAGPRAPNVPPPPHQRAAGRSSRIRLARRPDGSRVRRSMDGATIGEVARREARREGAAGEGQSSGEKKAREGAPVFVFFSAQPPFWFCPPRPFLGFEKGAFGTCGEPRATGE